ncbi:MAG: hypothetical protein HY429_00230 [Candidatus Levybacteria bacterium]|nr:hypothetical protein [Candidatus Levybacteria bacterium]
MTRFLLDSGDPDEYREISSLAKQKGQELWGSTTNPTLIAKTISSKKITQDEAIALQKEIALEILKIVPGAVSVEVYADEITTAKEMISQGRDFAAWDKRIVVKIPTNIEGFKARSVLRKDGILTNNTLVFSLEQIFAICLHEEIIQQTYGPINSFSGWPPFVSPFVGRLDDSGVDGMELVEQSMVMKQKLNFTFPQGRKVWMLEASVRSTSHIKRGINAEVELLTAPATVYKEWFTLKSEEREKLDTQQYAASLSDLPKWEIPHHLLPTATEDAFFHLLTTDKLNIRHPLTDKGILRFAEDWKSILV